VRGSRVIAIIVLVAALGGIALALALKHQRNEINARQKAKIRTLVR
jgi:hypothetical protein